MSQLRRSPFKLLDSFTRADAAVFFGREAEVEALYESINKNRLVLVYGPSGAGKTSLIQCGLATRFDATDWLPFFIKRGENINSALRQTLAENPALANAPPDDLPAAIGRLGSRYLRPVYLIFDQFEELLISGRPEERDDFIRDLKKLLDFNGESACHILLVLREEYLAALYPMERAIPGLFDRRLRVEPMHGEKLGEVIRRSCRAFNIALEDELACPELMLKNLGAEKNVVALPHLQVYLDMLYREDFQRDYPDGYAVTEEQPYPPLRFTTDEIEAFGLIDDVLEKFLDNILQTLRPVLKKQKWPEDTLAKILDAFVTEDGTKRPLYFEREARPALLPREKSIRKKLENIPNEALQYCLQELERNRLIHITEDAAELAHDSLAALLDRRRSAEERRLNEARQRLQNARLDFELSGEYLSRKQLNSLEALLPRLQLNPDLQKFVDDSSADASRRERRKQIANLAIGSILVLAAVVSFLFFLRAQADRQEARDNLERFLRTQAVSVKTESAERLSRAERLRADYPAITDSIRRDVRTLLEPLRQENPEISRYLDSLETVWEKEK